MRFVLVIGLFSGTFAVAMSTKRILFGVVNDHDIYNSEIEDVIQNVMVYFSKTMNKEIPFTIEFFKQLEGLRQQFPTCGIPGEIRVLISATSCGRMLRLSRECAKLEILHFVVNINDCIPPQDFFHRSFVDSVPSKGVVKAISDVVVNRSQDSDILVLHDAQYERTKTVNALLQDLGAKGFSHTYFKIDEERASLVAKKVGYLNKGTMQLDSVVLVDFSAFKRILDEMYSREKLNPAVSYLIVNDGWEAENPEIEIPQSVHYDIDIQMFLLKRKLQPKFSSLLSDMACHTPNNHSMRFHYSTVPYLVREDVFLAAAAFSIVDALDNFPIEKFNSVEKCHNVSNFSIYHQEVSNFVRTSLQNMGVLAKSLTYELYRNVPVNSTFEIFELIAFWKSDSSNRLNYLQSETKLLFENKTLKIALPFSPPYTMQSESEEEAGTLSNLFKYLTKHLHFNYEILCPEDNEWGVKISEKNWSGAINMLLKRHVDMVPFLGITLGRNQVLDFSQPVMTTASGILVRKPRESSRAFIFLRPFKIGVWICITLAALAMGVVLYLINYYSPYYKHTALRNRKGGLFKLRNCLWYVFGAILQQGGVYLPEALSARILVSFWWLFVLVTMATYSGHLISFLTFPDISWSVSSIEELAADHSLVVYMMEGNSIHQEIYESPSEALNLLRMRFETKTSAFVSTNFSTIMDDVRSGTAALIDDIYILYNIIDDMYNESGKCELAIVPEQFSEMYLAIATRKGSPYIKDIDKLIRHLWHGGLMQNWATVYSMHSQECNFHPNMLRGGRRDVNISDMQGAFYLLCFGIGFSFFVVCLEMSWRKYRRCRKSKVYVIS